MDIKADHKTKTTAPGADKRSEDRINAAIRMLPRRKFFSDMPDKGLFALVSLLGFAGILVLKRYSPLNSEIIAAIAVGIMLLYGFVAFQMPLIQLRPDRLGDNFYYLGFIYTLASLSAALLQLSISPRIEDLLGNFGIALVTTVVGVAGRVLFVQMRGEIDDVEDRVRRDLAAASTDLRAQLGLALREFETFHTGVLQTTSEAVKRASQHAESQIDQIGKVAEAAIESSKNAAESQVGQIGKVADAAIERLNNSATAYDARVTRLTEALTKVDEAVIKLPGMLEPLLVELQKTVEKIRGRRKWYWPFRMRH